MKIVFSIGGSILAPEKVDTAYVKKLSQLLTRLSLKHEVAVVVGGGRPARDAIRKVRKRGASWAVCDHIGILATRNNARALAKALGGKSNRKIPESISEAAGLCGGRILVMGGTEPGHSTDAVAALLGDWIKADLFINASNVDAVYDRNPKKHRNARPLRKISVGKIEKLLQSEGFNAGEYPLLDPTALKVIKRTKLKTIILDGRDLTNILAAAEGKPFNGTVITP